MLKMRDRISGFFLLHRDFWIGLTSVCVFMVLWEIFPRMGWLDPFFSSSPSRIIITAQTMFQSGFWVDIQVSLVEFIWGMLLASLFGIGLGLLVGWYRTLYSTLEPFITMLNAAPRVALIPLLILCHDSCSRRTTLRLTIRRSCIH